MMVGFQGCCVGQLWGRTSRIRQESESRTIFLILSMSSVAWQADLTVTVIVTVTVTFTVTVTSTLHLPFASLASEFHTGISHGSFVSFLTFIQRTDHGCSTRQVSSLHSPLDINHFHATQEQALSVSLYAYCLSAYGPMYLPT